MVTAEELNALSKRVLDAAYAVHSELGAGLLESTYVACLLYELRKRGLKVETEAAVPVIYDRTKMVDVGYRMDMLIEGELVLEVKAVEGISPAHHAQLVTYLKHSNKRLGLLLNFNEPYLKDGICRKVNRLCNGKEQEGREDRQVSAKIAKKYVANFAGSFFAIFASFLSFGA